MVLPIDCLMLLHAFSFNLPGQTSKDPGDRSLCWHKCLEMWCSCTLRIFSSRSSVTGFQFFQFLSVYLNHMSFPIPCWQTVLFTGWLAIQPTLQSSWLSIMFPSQIVLMLPCRLAFWLACYSHSFSLSNKQVFQPSHLKLRRFHLFSGSVLTVWHALSHLLHLLNSSIGLNQSNVQKLETYLIIMCICGTNIKLSFLISFKKALTSGLQPKKIFMTNLFSFLFNV